MFNSHAHPNTPIGICSAAHAAHAIASTRSSCRPSRHVQIGLAQGQGAGWDEAHNYFLHLLDQRTLLKPPSIAELLDWLRALDRMGINWSKPLPRSQPSSEADGPLRVTRPGHVESQPYASCEGASIQADAHAGTRAGPRPRMECTAKGSIVEP